MLDHVSERLAQPEENQQPGSLFLELDLVYQGTKARLENEALVRENERLKHEANTDPLTGLLNRKGVIEQLSNRIEKGEKASDFGIIFIDLDMFKAVNDQLSHNIGDDLLKDLGTHLSKAFKRSGDIIGYHDRNTEVKEPEELNTPVGRMGGDEFIIIVDLKNSPEAGHKRAETVEERLEGAFNLALRAMDDFIETRPKEIVDLGFNYSKGRACWSAPGSNIPTLEQIAELLEKADKNMYKDKRTHKNRRERVAS